MAKWFNSLKGMYCFWSGANCSEVRIWDVKKLQIQSESFLPASDDLCGIAVDGHRGIIYTLASSGVSPPRLMC